MLDCAPFNTEDVYHYVILIYLLDAINDCLLEPCQNGGTCTDDYAYYYQYYDIDYDDYNYGVDGAYNCTCLPGYTGSNCQCR